MIDIHCHLLPGIDDGAQTLEDSLELCRIAVDNGITHAVCTPHIHPGRFDNDVETIGAAYALLRAAVLDADIPIVLGCASEVRVSMEMAQLIPAGKVPYLGEIGGYQVMLLELPHSHVPPGSDKLAQWLIGQGIMPMIAHPERNKDIMRDVGKLQPFIDLGCLVQVTAGAVAGEFGKAAKARADDLLARGWVTVLASDAHDRKHRPPDLAAGRRAAAEVVGEAEATRLVVDAPLAIVQAQLLTAACPPVAVPA